MKQQAAQVYFPVATYLQIKVLAKKENVSLASWIRDAVEEKAKKSQKHQKKITDWPTFKWGKKNDDTSNNIDKIAYDIT